ncbi:NUDIX hydrolase [uncultured Roseobacter sp.]|uniref:NUDIX hydrolase n=1 Tax=uncultured Roseobacter sp. TaxID=114847 RepID=UPI00344D730E
MINIVKTTLENAMRVFTGPARERQVAALCFRETKKGKKVLLVTSRGTGRWIVPKGWPIKGLDDPDAALQEAWEEAGVKSAEVEADPVGHYDYDKLGDSGEVTPVKAQVYLAEVETLAESYPEDHQRERRWFTPDEAAARVREPELKAILRDF